QASASQAQRQWFSALFHWNRLIAAQPNDVSFLEQRGMVHAELKQWGQAAADFSTAIEGQPNNMTLWYHRAAAHLGWEDRDSYRRVCAELFTRFHRTTDALVAQKVVQICVAAPRVVPDSAALVALAKRAAGMPEGDERILMAALYRAGRYDEAVEQFNKAAGRGRPMTAWDWLFLALIQHHRGQAAEARNALARATAWSA